MNVKLKYLAFILSVVSGSAFEEWSVLLTLVEAFYLTGIVQSALNPQQGLVVRQVVQEPHFTEEKNRVHKINLPRG